MDYDFFAYLARMKYIKRWALMRSNTEENIMEHSLQVAEIAHAIGLIKNEIYGGKVDLYKVLCFSVYHEASEVITGDLPTPIKYFNSQINSAYKDLENLASERLISKLPDELKPFYRDFILCDKDSDEYKIMKAADRIAAYVKCVDEVKSGNSEFAAAKESIGKDIRSIDDQAVRYFIEKILPSFEKTLDELKL